MFRKYNVILMTAVVAITFVTDAAAQLDNVLSFTSYSLQRPLPQSDHSRVVFTNRSIIQEGIAG